MSDIIKRPIVCEIFCDDDAHSHYELIDDATGEVLWSSDPFETMANGQPIKNYTGWIRFYFSEFIGKALNKPSKPGRYLVCRQDGKQHMEQWNGTGWAYNHNQIVYWKNNELPEGVKDPENQTNNNG